MSLRPTLFAAIAGAAIAFSGPAIAAWDGGGTVSKPKCTENQTPRQDDCVSLRPGGLDDEQLYEHGRHYALSGDYERALMFLERADLSDPRVLNYTGYTVRKMGDVRGGLVYYSKALEFDPNFILARSYRGEGFLTLGMRNAAQADLTAIANIDGTESEAYRRLAAAISAYDNGTYNGATY